MTHDELIENLEAPWVDQNLVIKRADKYRLALLAIAQLHSNDHGLCMTCKMEDYPCESIRIIDIYINPATPNDFYGRSCQKSGHEFAKYQTTLRCIWCGDFNYFEVKVNDESQAQ